MRAVNNMMNLLGDLAFAPFGSAPPWVALVALSAVAGLLMMIVFKYTSYQTKLKAVSDRTRADLLAMKLFKDDLSVTFASQWDLLRATGKRLWYSLWPPMAVMIVPFVLAIAQIGVRYEFRPLAIGEHALVTLRLSEDAFQANAGVPLEAPDGVEVVTGPVRVPAEATIYWEVRVAGNGDHELAWQINHQRILKSLPANGGLRPVSPRRPTTGFWDQLLYPLEEPFLATSPARSIEVGLPQRSTPILGLDIHWLISFFVLSMVFALLLKPFLKVQL
ncbi:MAG: hypothetical protein JSU68_12995 [Phycisphaerales bacterium]|nr:MAG: hypothetical protein JSU68_12995 [Phycisphaerales bacterium]